MLTVFVRDVSSRKARKVEGGGASGHLCGQFGVTDLPLTVGVESGGGRRLAWENEYKLAAVCGSRDSGRETERDCGFQPHSQVLWTLGDKLRTKAVPGTWADKRSRALYGCVRGGFTTPGKGLGKASRLWSQVNRLPVTQVPHGGQRSRVGLLSYLVPAFWGLNFSRFTIWGRRDGRIMVLGVWFASFDSSDCPFLKQEEEEQGEEGGDGAAGDPKKERKP